MNNTVVFFYVVIYRHYICFTFSSSVMAIYHIHTGKIRYGRYAPRTRHRSLSVASEFVTKHVNIGIILVATCAPYVMHAMRNQDGYVLHLLDKYQHATKKNGNWIQNSSTINDWNQSGICFIRGSLKLDM